MLFNMMQYKFREKPMRNPEQHLKLQLHFGQTNMYVMELCTSTASTYVIRMYLYSRYTN